MRDSIHSTQVVTPFGSGYVPEDHGRGPALEEPRKRSRGKLAMVLTVALFGATTAAAAIVRRRSRGGSTTTPARGAESEWQSILKNGQ